MDIFAKYLSLSKATCTYSKLGCIQEQKGCSFLNLLEWIIEKTNLILVLRFYSKIIKLLIIFGGKL